MSEKKEKTETTEKKEEPVYLIFRPDGTSLIPLKNKVGVLAAEKYVTTEAIDYLIEKGKEEE